MEIKFKRTPRRFPYVEFKDCYGSQCSIQLSSSLELDCLWIGINDAEPKIMARDANELGLVHLLKDGPERLTGWVNYPFPKEVLFTTRMHLRRDQIKALLPILQHFVETGMFPSEKKWIKEKRKSK